MKLSLTYPAYKKCLLPLIMAVAVFFVSQGIRLPDFSNLQQPQLSASQKTTSSDSAFVKTVTKAAQTKTSKSVNFFAFASRPVQVNTPAVLVSDCQQQPRPFISSVVSIIPARAPPA